MVIYIFKSALKETLKDESGAFTVFWALVITLVLVCTGSAYDINVAVTAKAKAQNFADSIALTAAINVKANDGLPQTDQQGYIHAKTYNLSNIGYFITPYVKTDAGSAQENWAVVNYDVDAGQLTVEVTGNAKTAFMGMFGINEVPFRASTTVDYAVDDINNSLSIALVLDTSGSMWYHDETGVKREDAMEAAALDLMINLETLVIGQEDDGRILRTGIIPYYSYIWWSKVVNMKWGRVSDNSINSLWEGGGTNASDAMELADTWMQSETAYHIAETGRDDPKKYVILMTDGVNNYTPYDTQTLAACTSMKDQGVTVYTIGYALNPQTYSSDNYWDTYTPPQAEIDRATDLLSQCATSADHFKTTDNDTDLAAIFDGIGAEIAAQFLRISH